MSTVISFKGWHLNGTDRLHLQQLAIRKLNEELVEKKEGERLDIIRCRLHEIEMGVDDRLRHWIRNEIENNGKKWNTELKNRSLTSDIVWELDGLIVDQVQDKNETITMIDEEMIKMAETYLKGERE